MVDLIRQLIQLNPYMRYCAAEALRQDLFDEVRDSCLETPAEQKIKLESPTKIKKDPLLDTGMLKEQLEKLYTQEKE